MKFLFFALSLVSCSFAVETVDDYYEEAKSCQEISCIREHIDEINERLLDLLAKRTAYVKRAGDLKAKNTKVAQDSKRVALQEKKVQELALARNLPEEIFLQAFRLIVENSTTWQQKLIDLE